MNILILTWFFAPANTIGAVRLGATAAGLREHGHDVRVIAARSGRYQETLPLPVPAESVHYTGWWDVNAARDSFAIALRRLRRGTSRPPAAAVDAALPKATGGPTAQASPGLARRFGARLSGLYVNLTNWPDWQIGWLPHVVREARTLIRDWRPDVVFASGPPFTTLLAGYVLCRRSGLPLVVEFRDRWSDDPYYPPPPWRHRIDAWGERRIVALAKGLVTVSEPWEEAFQAKYGKPTVTIYNGYDNDFEPTPATSGANDVNFLKIRYLGHIYPGRRDPSTLFAAMKLLDDAPVKVRAEFYGTDAGQVWPLAEGHGVRHLVDVFPRVPYEQSVALQRQADALLLMQWNDPKEQGNVPGKFFEYLGARRPIVGLGYDEGVPARLIRERGAGVYTNDPNDLAATLAMWLETKHRQGHLPWLDAAACAGFSRGEQISRLNYFLESLVVTGG
ncbi:MAG: hypothetical protein EA405_11280 [Rhodospirillales bacterium]|nr:MAG: hypothetical protein EA405_11280 [Rhodospirillales bacterium]